MTEHTLTIRDADGRAAVAVTITALGTDAGDELAERARDAIATALPDGQVIERDAI